jgi:hypothetical protein
MLYGRGCFKSRIEDKKQKLDTGSERAYEKVEEYEIVEHENAV